MLKPFARKKVPAVRKFKLDSIAQPYLFMPAFLPICGEMEGNMNNKKFIIILSCLTAAFCMLIVVYNFASMPPYGTDTATAAALYTNASSKEETAADASSGTDSQTASGNDDADDANYETTSKKGSLQTSKKLAASKTSDSVSSVNSGSNSSSKSAKSAASSSKATPQSPVNINTANLEQLESVPYIGPTKAQAILDYRSAHGTFSSVDELDSVKGIGTSTINKIRQYVTN